MFKSIYLKTEIKKLFREPIMALLFLVPLIIPVLFRLLLTFLVPFILNYLYFDISLYEHYILSLVLLMNAMLLSIVMGFTMIDDRDNKIAELMSITPMGKSGYLFMRLALVSVFVVLYSVYSYFALGIFIIPMYTLLGISFILCLYSGIMGLLLFSVATDKVNGLTYAKGLNSIAFFAFADLLNIEWLNILSGFFPPYWITKIIADPTDLFSFIMGALISAVWFGIFLAKTKF